MTSWNDIQVANFRGIMPAVMESGKEIADKVITETLPQYSEFMQSRFICDSIENARKIVKDHGIKKNSFGSEPFFITDEEAGVNGAVGSAFALVKPGKKDKPFRIIIAHSDVPSLRIPANPVYTATDTSREMSTSTISLCTEPFGGVRIEDWTGVDVDIIGKMYIGGKEKKVEMPGRIKARSLHVDHPAIMKDFDSLKVDTGFSTAEDLYRFLGIKSADDFSRARLYCLPRQFKDKKRALLIGLELGGYGHDDRCCVWAGLKAGLETRLETDNTTMFFALDNEEIGGIGNSASYRGFFENVLRETVKVVYGKKDAANVYLPGELNRKLLGDMPAIFADVGVGLGSSELENPLGLVDMRGASRLGWGIMIGTGIVTSPKHVDRFITMLEKKLPGKKRNQRYQIGGDYMPADLRPWGASGQMYDSFGDSIPSLNVGIPVCGLHHPGVEAINIFDLHWMKEAYKLYMKE